MNEIKPELNKCSRCRFQIELQHFSTNPQGELYKLCNDCRTYNNQIVNCEACEINYTNKQISKHYNTRKHILASVR